MSDRIKGAWLWYRRLHYGERGGPNVSIAIILTIYVLFVAFLNIAAWKANVAPGVLALVIGPPLGAGVFVLVQLMRQRFYASGSGWKRRRAEAFRQEQGCGS
jgi:hypothetical protein